MYNHLQKTIRTGRRKLIIDTKINKGYVSVLEETHDAKETEKEIIAEFGL